MLLVEQTGGLDSNTLTALKEGHPYLHPLKPYVARNGISRHANEAVAAAGAMRDGYHILAAINAGKSSEDKITACSCMCGREQPSKNHLLWACQSMEQERLGLQLTVPTNFCEETLLIRILPVKWHERRLTEGIISVIRNLAQALLAADKEDDGRILVATDAGRQGLALHDSFAAVGVAIRDHAWGAELQLLDTSTYAVEWYAANIALAAAQMAQVNVRLLIDNDTAGGTIRKVLDGRQTSAPLGMVQNTAALVAGRSHACSWVPSHGKQRDWRPPAPFQEQGDHWRRLNSKADGQATHYQQECLRRHAASIKRHEGAERHTQHAVLLSCLAAEKLGNLHAAQTTDSSREACGAFARTFTSSPRRVNDRFPIMGTPALAATRIGWMPAEQSFQATQYGDWLKLYHRTDVPGFLQRKDGSTVHFVKERGFVASSQQQSAQQQQQQFPQRQQQQLQLQQQQQGQSQWQQPQQPLQQHPGEVYAQSDEDQCSTASSSASFD